MKKLLIPILSLSFIVSLNSCNKDSDDPQPEEDTTRIEKLNYTYSGGSDFTTMLLEYDDQGRVTKLKDSSNPNYYISLTYNGDEVVWNDKTEEIGANDTYIVRYRLNSNYQPVQRISVEINNSMDDPQNTYYSEYKDTLKYEYDAAGLLLKATGGSYDSSWSITRREVMVLLVNLIRNTYTNKDGKLMSFKVSALQASNSFWDNNPYKENTKTEGTFTFEYNKNFANKTNDKNAWILAEKEVLMFDYKYPLIKTYSTLPDKFSYTGTTTDAQTGDLKNESKDEGALEAGISPSGLVSTAKFLEILLYIGIFGRSPTINNETLLKRLFRNRGSLFLFVPTSFAFTNRDKHLFFKKK